MSRAAVYTLAILLALMLAIRFYPDLSRALRAPVGPAPPGAGPGMTPSGIDGPYFSDAGRVADAIVGAVNHSRRTLEVAMYDLTEPNIAGAIEAAARRGVKVRIVADEQQSEEPHSEIPYLRGRGVPVRLSRGYRGNRSIMHNKFAVFDAELVETGSFNWTTSADAYNFENAIFIRDPSVVARYAQEFERLWAQAE